MKRAPLHFRSSQDPNTQKHRMMTYFMVESLPTRKMNTVALCCVIVILCSIANDRAVRRCVREQHPPGYYNDRKQVCLLA